MIGPTDLLHPSPAPHFKTFQVFLICCPKRPSLTSLTYTNSTFSPHSVFTCFVWISEQTIISLYSINWLVFITDSQSVHCAVRAETLYNSRKFSPFKTVPWLRWSVADVSPRTSGFDPRPVSVRFVADKLALEQGSPAVLLFSPVVSIVPPLLHPHLHLNVALARTKKRSVGTYQKAMLFRKSE